ncbi:MAG: cold shock domain-containing protein [Paenisporosarcina sp.]
MTLIERLLGRSKEDEELNDSPQVRERITGKIIKISPEGWGFITSKEIKFTRIFFHWSALNQDTLHFTELERGMEVEFEPLEVSGKGVRAIRIKILLEEDNE